uniref:Uncharacterized protein n=1 Tax=Babesia bovis TaxID=5865 RepID=S6B3C4_BABBO|nr:hypothetical protein [Babesia bovis]
MKAAGAESSTGASKAKVNTPERSYNTEKYKLLLVTVATSWSASVLMCVFHLALCIRLINKRCESSVIQFNARCAGYLLIFGCCKSLCATLVGPLRVIHGILHRDVTVFRKGIP